MDNLSLCNNWMTKPLHTNENFICVIRPRSEAENTPLMTFADMGRPSPSVMTKVPTEIWKSIIVLACVVPRALDTSSTSSFTHSEVEYNYKKFKDYLYASHDTKKSIKLVSHYFYDLVYDLCCQFLLLRDVEAGVRLPFKWWEVAINYRYDVHYKEKMNLRGDTWYVKYLEIVIQDDAETSEVDKIEAMGIIIACCPNIVVLSLNIPALPGASGIPYPVFNALFPSPVANFIHLRKLAWNSDITSATDFLLTHLPSLINLESFHINIQHQHHFNPSAANISLLALHTLEVIAKFSDPSNFLRVAKTWNMDQIRQFRLTTAVDALEPLPFYTTHGPKLDSLDFNYLGSESGPKILSQCTALKDMVVQVRWVNTHISKLCSKTVERIGIRGTQFKYPIHFSEDVFYLFAWFEAILSPFILASDDIDQLPIFCNHSIPTGDWDEQEMPSPDAYIRMLRSFGAPMRPYRFPALHTIRLLNFYPALFQERKWLSQHVTLWGLWEKRLERFNIRLEDHEGKPIKINFSTVNFWLNGDPPCWQYGYIYK